MSPRKAPALAALLALATLAPRASAGERTSLRALPVLPAAKDASVPSPAMGVPGLAVAVKETPHSKYVLLSARRAQGYCLVTRDTTLSLSDETTSTEPGELWRFVEADGKASLERTRFEVAVDRAWVKSKDRIELRALASGHGVTAWGLREASGDVLVLAKSGTAGVEAVPPPGKEEVLSLPFTSSSCAFAATRITAAVVTKGAAAQLSGDLPAEGEGKSKVVPRFVVDVSASKVTRDPEPVLSVRIRRFDPSP